MTPGSTCKVTAKACRCFAATLIHPVPVARLTPKTEATEDRLEGHASALDKGGEWTQGPVVNIPANTKSTPGRGEFSIPPPHIGLTTVIVTLTFYCIRSICTADRGYHDQTKQETAAAAALCYLILL